MSKTHICRLCFFSVFLLLFILATANAQDKAFSDNDCDGGPELGEPLGDTGQFGFEKDQAWHEANTGAVNVEQVSDNDCDGGPELGEPLGDTGRFGFDSEWEEEPALEKMSDNNTDRGPELGQPLGDTGRFATGYES